MSIGICTLTIGQEYRKKVELGVKSKELYCKKWHYEFINETKQLDMTRPIAWSKIDLILRELDRFDYLVWMDADTLICNYNISIKHILKMLPKDKSLLIGHDLNCLNSGVMVIKNTPIIKELFTKMQRTTKFNNHCWWEQRALVEYYYDFKDNIEVIPQEKCHLINGYIPEVDPKHPYVDGDWCLHLAGIRDVNVIKIFMEKYFRQPLQ